MQITSHCFAVLVYIYLQTYVMVDYSIDRTLCAANGCNFIVILTSLICQNIADWQHSVPLVAVAESELCCPW